ncbi:hypothetical protein, partial [Limosilactobacillus reuteri]|uniref:hypothetical protein n=1 Tax=Limosilactobacillus reuteri TaxID=1598 RepID=UPI001CDD8146
TVRFRPSALSEMTLNYIYITQAWFFDWAFCIIAMGDVYETYKGKLAKLVSKIIDNCYPICATILCLAAKLAD